MSPFYDIVIIIIIIIIIAKNKGFTKHCNKSYIRDNEGLLFTDIYALDINKYKEYNIFIHFALTCASAIRFHSAVEY